MGLLDMLIVYSSNFSNDALNQRTFVLGLTLSLYLFSCGDDHSMDNIGEAAEEIETFASVTIDGVSYEKNEESEVLYFRLPNTEDWSIGINVKTQNDEILIGLQVPEIGLASYAKENFDFAVVSAQIFADFSDQIPAGIYSSTGPVFDSVPDFSDFEINITDIDENTISGDFDAVIQDFLDTVHFSIAGTFTAVDSTVLRAKPMGE